MRANSPSMRGRDGSAAGTELFCVDADGTVYTVPMQTSPALVIGRPRALFTRGLRLRWIAYDVTADGRSSRWSRCRSPRTSRFTWW
jgi:hypothetical protein